MKKIDIKYCLAVALFIVIVLLWIVWSLLKLGVVVKFLGM